MSLPHCDGCMNTTSTTGGTHHTETVEHIHDLCGRRALEQRDAARAFHKLVLPALRVSPVGDFGEDWVDVALRFRTAFLIQEPEQ